MAPSPAAAATTAATTTFVASEYSTGDNFEGWYLQTTRQYRFHALHTKENSHD